MIDIYDIYSLYTHISNMSMLFGLKIETVSLNNVGEPVKSVEQVRRREGNATQSPLL